MEQHDLISRLQKIQESTPRHPDLWFDLAVLMYASGRPSDALVAIDAALEINPRFQDAGLLRCFLVGECESNSAGLHEFRRWINRSTECFDTTLALGVYTIRCGHSRIGAAQLRRAALMRPACPFAFSLAAQAADESGQPEESAELVQMARKALDSLGLPAEATAECRLEPEPSFWESPTLVRATVIEADSLASSGRIEEAADVLQDIHERVPGHPRVMLELARIADLRGFTEVAHGWFEAVLVVEPGNDNALRDLSDLHAAHGELEAAEEALRRAVRLCPLYPDYQVDLGILLKDRGGEAEAMDRLRFALELKPDHGHAAAQLASLLLTHSKIEEAFEVLASDGCRSWAEALVTKALAHLVAGEREEARKLLERALREDPAKRGALHYLRGGADPGR